MWLVGSLNGRGWEQVWPLAVALGVLLPLTLAPRAARSTSLALGDDVARSARRRRRAHAAGLLAVAASLTGVAVAAAGPIGFVAFIAPHLARRLAGRTGAACCSPPRLRRAARDGRRPRRAPAVRADRDPGRDRHVVIAAPYFLLLLHRASRLGARVTRAAGGRGLTLGYGGRRVVDGPRLACRAGQSPRSSAPTAAASRPCCAPSPGSCAPRAGAVLLDGRRSPELPTREVARRLGLLPQSPVAPEGLTVEDLVARGRYPHQGLLRQWSRDDETPSRRRSPRPTPRACAPAARRALRRPAPAGLDRDGARAGHRDPAARRADDVPRPRPPGRGARPARPASTPSTAAPS